jgi:hypothetical protein
MFDWIHCRFVEGIPVLAVAGDRSAKCTFGIDVSTEMFSAFTKSAFGVVLICPWATICFIVFCKVQKRGGRSQKYTLMYFDLVWCVWSDFCYIC